MSDERGIYYPDAGTGVPGTSMWLDRIPSTVLANARSVVGRRVASAEVTIQAPILTPRPLSSLRIFTVSYYPTACSGCCGNTPHQGRYADSTILPLKLAETVHSPPRQALRNAVANGKGCSVRAHQGPSFLMPNSTIGHRSRTATVA